MIHSTEDTLERQEHQSGTRASRNLEELKQLSL
jgi:hypothetical protein